MRRRDFITTAARAWTGLVGLASVLRPQSVCAEEIPNRGDTPVDPHDETFWSRVRDQFPLTRERVYLNTGGLGASPRPVIDAVKAEMEKLERISETGHSGELWQSVKEKAGRRLGCQADEVAYTRNTTEGANIVCNGLPLKRGDEVITSTHEHVGNTLTWLARQKREGIVIKVFEPSMQSAQENLDRIERLITPRTRTLSISHVTCSTGQVLPVRRIGALRARAQSKIANSKSSAAIADRDPAIADREREAFSGRGQRQAGESFKNASKAERTHLWFVPL